jgi:hypothetical protein
MSAIRDRNRRPGQPLRTPLAAVESELLMPVLKPRVVRDVHRARSDAALEVFEFGASVSADLGFAAQKVLGHQAGDPSRH